MGTVKDEILRTSAAGIDKVPEDTVEDNLIWACVARAAEAPVTAVKAPVAAVEDMRPCLATGSDNAEAASGATIGGPDGQVAAVVAVAPTY